MYVKNFQPSPVERNDLGAVIPPHYSAPKWTESGHAMRTSAGVLIGGALIRPRGPAANDDYLHLVPAVPTRDSERIAAALLDPRTAKKSPIDRALRLLHILRTDVRARRLLRAALYESTVKRLTAWL